ncbi:hypothetical protein Q2T40_18375 [Winogradskyella maritima]|uniref:Uncharacterized protein n=1 Tax=Winogradskyella maritima TaxID=1517766 RepID=A0ABV8AGY7_9FLAO|nr:hypothetical protein [Winogradskyella maritima]
MKNTLTLLFLMTVFTCLGQASAGIEKQDYDGRIAWFAVNKHNKKVIIEYKLITDKCNGEPIETIKTKIVIPHKRQYLQHFKNGDCYGGKKLYNKCIVLSKKFID